MAEFEASGENRNKLSALVVAVVLVLSIGSASLSAVSNSSSKTSVSNCPSGYPCGPENPNVLVDESQIVNYTSLDPALGWYTQDFATLTNVFQGLVSFNPHNTTEVVPALASKWAVGGGPLYKSTPNYYTQWNFTMRDNTWFSNRDPINAYVAWFSFVRELYVNTAPGYVDYLSVTFNSTNPLDVTPDANVFPDGLQNALASAGLCAVNPKNDSGCVRALNYMLSNFNWQNETQLRVMTYPDQAYVAVSSSLFQINTIQPYSLTLLILPSSWGAMVDPRFIDSKVDCGGNPCGGVQNSTWSYASYFSVNGMPGSGPYEFGNHTAEKYGSGTAELFLNNNTNYWGDRVTGLPPNLQPARIGTIDLRYGSPSRMDDFSTNKAQITTIATPPFYSPGNFSKLWSTFHSEFPFVPFS